MELTQHIESLICQSGIPLVGLAYHSFETGESFALRGDRPFQAASMMKVPVMVEVFAQGLDLDRRVPIVNRFASLIGAEPFSLSPEDDADTSLYERVGQNESIGRLVELMITRSGNLATNILVDILGADRVTARMAALGLPELVVRRGVMDEAAFQAGLNNTATAAAFNRLMILMGRGEIAASGPMIEILGRQEHNDAIPAGVPHGTLVAHKTGWNTDIVHDGGIVMKAGRPRFALTVLTKGAQSKPEAERLIAAIATACWRAA